MSPHPTHRVRIVGSFDELVGTAFSGDVNALCWQRQLDGDFQAVVAALLKAGGIDTADAAGGGGMHAVDADDLDALTLTAAGAAARAILKADQALLAAHGLAPTLDVITGYPRDEAAGPIPTDVYSLHVDSAPVAADTYLCTYAGAASEGLANEQAMRRVDDPAIRAALLAAYGGADDADFAAYLAAHHYDRHYQPLPGAVPYSFGVGHLWRIAIATPDSPVLPCIHRAPLTLPGAPPRLLAIC